MGYRINHIMRRPVIFLLLLSICFATCHEKLFTAGVDCSECYYPEPDSAYIKVHLTVNDRFPEVPLVVYKGEPEENQVEWVDTAISEDFSLYVQVNQKYSVKAAYKKGNATIYVVDGTKIKALLVQNECEGGECWVVENETLDARIKDDFLNYWAY
jgi:hypothetical protein